MMTIFQILRTVDEIKPRVRFSRNEGGRVWNRAVKENDPVYIHRRHEVHAGGRGSVVTIIFTRRRLISIHDQARRDQALHQSRGTTAWRTPLREPFGYMLNTRARVHPLLFIP